MNTSMKQRIMTLVVMVAVVVMALGAIHQSALAAEPSWRVDANGNITKNGTIFRIKGASWFGLEGRYEISSDAINPRGAPMEEYMGNVFWASSSRTYASDISEFVGMGLNTIRLPLVHESLSGTDPQGMDPYLKNTSSVRIANSLLALQTIVKDLDSAGMAVILDIHSCSNYVDWRKGRFDARPPWTDANRANYDYKREDCSCASSNNPSTVTRIQAYDESTWLADLKNLAGWPASLGVSNIMGIDMFNEPWDYTWSEWMTMVNAGYSAANAVDPNLLYFVQGVGVTADTEDGTPSTTTSVPFGPDTNLNPNWGENLYNASATPPSIPKNQLVFDAHTYGPSVFVQRQFLDPSQTACAGLDGDNAAAAKCNIVINPTLLATGWQEHFGYLKALGYGLVIGEFGGNPAWPGGKASLRDQSMWSYITDHTVDWQWQTAFVNYLVSAHICDTIYWSLNPESGDTGGLYTTPYDPSSNTGGWGTWTGVDTQKTGLLANVWGSSCVSPNGTTATATPTSNVPVATSTHTRTPTTGPSATRTRTPTAGPSLTRTRTPTTGPTTAVTATPTTPPNGPCSPVSSTITAPFTYDGTGTYCWQSSNLGSYINSWNLNAGGLKVNGVDETNLYVASGSLPAKVNGYWYVAYVGTTYGHFEAK